ncbi:MAG TPA: maleylpyruvate isomerase family mycothiol-dependent enzyme [Streptosporangiaceae bacterium]|nr:maleylpyruvate isomerase family mycothiol-dependent enzyme [Streptosporangiaceae bacterium]
MKIAEHLDALRREGELMAAAADRAGLAAAVPSCPAWQVKDLLRHTGYIHRWAARHITEGPAEVIDGPSEAEILRGGAADANLLGWFRAGHAALVEALASADPEVQCATFMPAPSPLAFWTRRQAHETAIHRADAELAAGPAEGTVPEYPPRFAADGIDELIMGFGQRRKYQPQSGPASRAGLLRMIAADTGHDWSVEAREGLLQPRRETGAAAVGGAGGGCTVSGPASGLYLYLWNRADAAKADVTVTGDSGLLASWQASVKVRWG